MAVRQIANSMRAVKVWFPVLVCCFAIFYFSSLPGDDIPGLFPYQDLVFHLFIYAVLGYFFIRAASSTFTSLSSAGRVLITLFFCFFYGVTDELHQLSIPGRHFSLIDLIINSAGAFLGGITYR